MHGPSTVASKRRRSAQPLPVVREMSRRTGTRSGFTTYVEPPYSNGSTWTCRSRRRPSPEVSPRRDRSKRSVRCGMPLRLGVFLELALEHLAGGGPRELVDERDVARRLVAGEVVLDVL